MVWRILLVGSAWLGFATELQAGPLGDLMVGETLTIRCDKRDCWNQERFEVQLTRAESLRAELIEYVFGDEGPARVRRGPIDISAADARRMDALYADFRQRTDYVSSSMTTVQTRHFARDASARRVRKLRFGGMPPDEFPGAFRALLAQAVGGVHPGAPEPLWRIAKGADSDSAVSALVQQHGLSEAFEAIDGVCDSPRPGDDALSVTLRPRRSDVFDSVEWTIPLVSGVPRSSPVLPILALAEARVRATPWLQAWKASSAENRLSLVFVCDERGALPDFAGDPSTVLWERSGLAGKPRWKIEASRDGDRFRRCRMTLVAGDADARLLLIDSLPADPSGWSETAPRIEALRTGPAGTDDPVTRYALICPDGTHELRETANPDRADLALELE